MNGEDINKEIEKTKEYAGKPFPRFLKYIGKIEKVSDFEEWIKATNKQILNWIIDYLILMPFVIFFCISALNRITFLNFSNIITVILFSEGVSILWYLILQFKKDLWRK